MNDRPPKPTLTMPADRAKKWNAGAVRDLRQRHGLTKTDFGRLLYEGVSSPHSPVTQIEEGDVNPGSAARRTLSRLDRMDAAAVERELEEIKTEQQQKDNQ